MDRYAIKAHLYADVFIQRDSKRWTHFVSLYGSNSKRRLNTRQTVGCGIPSSLLALRVHLRGQMLCRSFTYHVQFGKYRRTNLSQSF